MKVPGSDVQQGIQRRMPGTILLVLVLGLAACNKKATPAEPRGIAAALADYQRCRDKVLNAYDSEIAAAKRSGGPARARPLEEEMAKFLAREAGPMVVGFDRDAILQMLPEKKWYWHWETKNRARPFQIQVNDADQITADATSAKNWKLELRWIINDSSHLLIPIDEQTLKGFFVASGRQVGAFADPAGKAAQ